MWVVSGRIVTSVLDYCGPLDVGVKLNPNHWIYLAKIQKAKISQKLLILDC